MYGMQQYMHASSSYSIRGISKFGTLNIIVMLSSDNLTNITLEPQCLKCASAKQAFLLS